MKFSFCKLSLGLLLVASGAVVYAVDNDSQHNRAHRDLLNKQSKNKIVGETSFVDFSEDIEPEIDIYTEGWNSRKVNPFNDTDVPDNYVIDVRNYVLPVPGYVTSNYGYRPKFGRTHKGIDLKLNSNDTVVAAFDGKVRVVNYEAKGYGNYVIIRHPNGLETVYGHLNKQLVEENQTILAGEPIGLGGSTGRSTGPHLHFETRFMGYPINPAAIFDFNNHCTYSEEYTFSKKTYTEPRNYNPNHNG